MRRRQPIQLARELGRQDCPLTHFLTHSRHASSNMGNTRTVGVAPCSGSHEAFACGLGHDLLQGPYPARADDRRSDGLGFDYVRSDTACPILSEPRPANDQDGSPLVPSLATRLPRLYTQ
jgi:hypothetical protein